MAIDLKSAFTEQKNDIKELLILGVISDDDAVIMNQMVDAELNKLENE